MNLTVDTKEEGANMGDENLNNNEEAEALFVSAHKKKKAEEEAKRRAEEEKAKREAAEAEVRRMEYEVEQRKKKAEEEAQKINQKGERERVNPVNTSMAKTQAKPKSKVPVIIGIVAVVVVLFIVVGSVLGGKSSTQAMTDEIEFDTEYTPKEAGFSIPLTYPGALYSEVQEEQLENGIRVHLVPEKGRPELDFIMGNLGDAKGNMLTDARIFFYSSKDTDEMLSYTIDSSISEIYGDVEYTEQTSSLNNGGSTYMYSCKFKYGDSMVADCDAWITKNSNDEYKILAVCTAGSDGSQDNLEMVTDLVGYKNASFELGIPGSDPPESSEVNGECNLLTFHMKMPYPKDRFMSYLSGESSVVMSDRNAAMILITGMEVDSTMSAVKKNSAKIIEGIATDSENEGAPKMLSRLEDLEYFSDQFSGRTKEAEKIYDNFACAYSADFKMTYDGIEYWERKFTCGWEDVTTEKFYFVTFDMAAPYQNKDIYEKIFERMLEGMEDM